MRVLYFLLSALGAAVFLVGTFLLSLIALAVGWTGWQPIQSLIVRAFGRMGLICFRIRVRTHGDLTAPAQGGIYLFNHQSHLDILAMTAHLPPTFRFGAKIELFKIPFFGPAMRSFGVLPIPRNNRAEAFKVYEQACERLRAGALFALAPEGTRQLQPEIGPFKKGPFIFAIQCQAPLIPVILKGLHEALPKNEILPNTRRWVHTVDLKVLEPVSTEEESLESLEPLVGKTRELFIAEYGALGEN